MNFKTNNKKISTLTLAAGDTFYNNDEEKKFFFNSLINSKKILFDDAGLTNNYFLVSNISIYKEQKISNLIYNKEIINYGSLGSLIFFLNKITHLPNFLLVNYLDKKINSEDLNYLLTHKSKENLALGTKLKNSADFTPESFFHANQNYIFNGFLILNRETLKKIKKLDKKYYFHNLSYIFNSNLFNDSKFLILENKYKIDEIREKVDVAKILLGSKSKSIKNLKRIKTAQIPKFFVVNKVNSKELIEELKKLKDKIIIRSDSDFEDSFNESNAGKFLTIGPINKKEINKVKNAIKSVFDSYPDSDPSSRVMIQDYVKDIKISGVITTRVLQNGAPYFCISLSESDSSDEVTAGTSNQLKNIYIHKNIEKLSAKYKKYQKILDLIRELIEYTSYDLLDIEFAINTQDKLYLLQVRPLLVYPNTKDNKKELLKNIRAFQQLQNKSNSIFGERTVFSNMSDWNPAEMLGESPNYLSLSLYKTFITNDSWYKQRKEFGYKGKVSDKLLINFGNKCFIDVRASLNSFLTKSLSDEDSEKIIDYQINRLIKNPEFHDKIEFEIAETAYIFGLEEKLKKRYKNILSEDTIISWIKDLKALEKNYIKILEKNNKKIINFYNNLSENTNFFDKEIIRDIKVNMAIPFSHHARLAFIYFSHINNFVENGIISNLEKQLLLNNLNTISSQFSKNLLDVKNKKMTYQRFINLYGHIRPNNYDLNSNNLSQEGKDFINFLIDNLENEELNKNDISGVLKKIDIYLSKYKYSLNAVEWHKLFESSIISRENSKFMYSKAIDLTLNQIKNSEDFDQRRVNNLNYEIFSEQGKIQYEESTNNFELPDILTTSNDFLFFENLNTKPNFIGHQSVKGEMYTVSEKKNINFKNKIILLPNADPGWDWVLNLPIKGMITKYGGPNSHMAIRASEKNITSVFGIGEDLFNQLQNANLIEIDPVNKKLYLN